MPATKEAIVPKFFRGGTEGFFIAKFYAAQKQTGARTRTHTPPIGAVPPPAGRRKADQQEFAAAACHNPDARELSQIYRQVFESYPFPIHRDAHLRHMMKEGALYYCIREQHKIAAVTAAEIDRASQTAEMTDFATLPEHRSKCLAGILLRRLDREACQAGIKTAYTIARADSQGINRVFEKCGYTFAGILRHNSQIYRFFRSIHYSWPATCDRPGRGRLTCNPAFAIVIADLPDPIIF